MLRDEGDPIFNAQDGWSLMPFARGGKNQRTRPRMRGVGASSNTSEQSTAHFPSAHLQL